MKITILGAGVAASSYLSGKQNQWPPAFLVEWKGGKLLLECSQAVQQRLEQAGYDYASIQHIAISHPHPDHCAPIHFIQSVYCKGFFGGRSFVNEQITFYGPDYLIENFSTLWRVYIPNEKSLKWPKLHLVAMSKTKKSYPIGEARLSARDVYHGWGKCPAVAYRLETPEGVVAYSGDTGDCTGIREVARGADIFICEASARVGDTSMAHGYGHLDPKTVGEIAKEAGVKKVVLFHYLGLDSDEAIIEEVKSTGFEGEVIAGRDFEEITT